MENLDGILIATTNLTENLDKAFERRFLFKIRFDKPTLEAKTNIWRDKMPTLSETDATKLASSYDFSGGEIDNIVRKALMQEVISGEAPTIDDLQKLCSEEKIDKHNMRIGF
jgi:SpoVK/Ycf46/Vps4 family AAA+-type ATPase